MLHPDLVLNKSINLGKNSFGYQQEVYALLHDCLKLIYNYEIYRGTSSKVNELKVELIEKSLNYRVGQIVLFLSNLIIKSFRKMLHISKKKEFFLGGGRYNFSPCATTPITFLRATREKRKYACREAKRIKEVPIIFLNDSIEKKYEKDSFIHKLLYLKSRLMEHLNKKH